MFKTHIAIAEQMMSTVPTEKFLIFTQFIVNPNTHGILDPIVRPTT